jgi:hypothetical protein
VDVVDRNALDLLLLLRRRLGQRALAERLAAGEQRSGRSRAQKIATLQDSLPSVIGR